MLARTLTVALLAGVLAGALVSAAQMVRVVPLILEAEIYEVVDHSEHAADEATWSPEDGVERTVYTIMANLLVGVGFGLLLVGAFVLAETAGRPIDTLRGLLWGLAGFLVFALNPSVALPPELPGTPRRSFPHASSGGSGQPELRPSASVSSHSAGHLGSRCSHCPSWCCRISSARRSRRSTAGRPQRSSRGSSWSPPLPRPACSGSRWGRCPGGCTGAWPALQTPVSPAAATYYPRPR
jgi:hypothetical protein